MNPPELPIPTLRRWQPLRLGLVELYFYEDEEFWFRDGHLLLRGNNGTGKSKVLSLTLPFLLDANLSSTRVEPDGDRSKRMDWNLLLGSRHERRTGYSWIEFGRVDEDGVVQTLTLGCGMTAVAGRSSVDSWYFITPRRPRRDFSLINDERRVLNREQLGETLGSEHVYRTARDYRRAVDERLFHLGEARYEALMDTLIQLRQPQLSKKPDEGTLSEALSNSLPPLPAGLLDDVAQAMNQLDDYREELRQMDALSRAVAQFGERYRRYARIQSRRQARELRQAQTGFDDASREANQAQQDVHQAQQAEAQQNALLEALELQLRRDRAAVDALKLDPVMRDAERLVGAQRRSAELQRQAEDAGRQHETALRQQQREQAEQERRAQQLQHVQAQTDAARLAARQSAESAGIADEHAALAGNDHPLAEMRRLYTRRREQTAQLRRRLRELDEARTRRERVADEHGLRREARDNALQAATQAEQMLRDTIANGLQAWRDYLRQLQTLRPHEPEALLAALAEWAEQLQGESPARAVLAAAHTRVLEAISAERAQWRSTCQTLHDEDDALVREAADLDAGQDREPAPLPWRDAAARSGRDGAPFWQLADFREHIDDGTRAAVEAALQAAGLLDAWVTPDGAALPVGSADALLQPRQNRQRSLFDVLKPATDAAVPAARIEALLRGIAFDDDDPTDAEAWIGRDGRYRLASLQGRWHKPQAEYLGHAARVAARQRRLAQIAERRGEIAAALEEANAALQLLEARQQALATELAAAPSDEAWQRAHAQLAGATRQHREALDALAQVEQRLQEADARLRQTQRELDVDATDLRLPASADALQAVEAALQQYALDAQSLAGALAQCADARTELAQQDERLHQAGEHLQERAIALDERQQQAEQARAFWQTLQGSVGAAVSELQARLREKEQAVRDGESTERSARTSLSEAQQARARSEQKLEDTQQTLRERGDQRQHAVTQLQQFAGTGLLGLACPELVEPEQWSVDPALELARRAEKLLHDAPLADEEWNRIQTEVSRDYTALTQSLSALGQQALMETSDFGLVVQIVYRGRPLRPDRLQQEVDEEISQRRAILTAKEQELFENHMQAEVASALQRHLREAARRVDRINEELEKRPTSTGVRFKLEWQPLPEGGADGAAPTGLAEARTRLLNRVADAWSPEDRALVGRFLQARIEAERSGRDNESGTLAEQLARALDYRRWHRFRVKRWQDGSWKPLSGPASSGERALGLTVPLFAAAASHYASGGYEFSPRLVLLDEAFAGIDDEARAHCMGLIREFDLDFVMTSEREWGCHATLPGVAICQIVRREGIDAVFVSRWTWDGRARRQEVDPLAVVTA